MKAKYFDRYGNEVDQRHACDDHGALRNGCTMRVPFQARDGLSTTQLAVRDAAARDARARAYELYDQEIQQAWRNTDPRGRSFESTGFGSSGPRGQSEGDACTIDGRSGHLKMVGGQLQCVPDKIDAVPLIDSFGHRPGFAFVNDAATREARARMYALKDVEYENAWRGPNATCPSCQGSGEADDGSECETCRGEGILNPSYEANAEETYRSTATHRESLLRHRADNRSVSEMVCDHRAHMAAVYAAYDRDLTQSWRHS
jgi:hypothetical protein